MNMENHHPNTSFRKNEANMDAIKYQLPKGEYRWFTISLVSSEGNFDRSFYVIPNHNVRYDIASTTITRIKTLYIDTAPREIYIEYYSSYGRETIQAFVKYQDFLSTDPLLISKWISYWIRSTDENLKTLPEFVDMYLKDISRKVTIDKFTNDFNHMPNVSEKAILEAYADLISTYQWN